MINKTSANKDDTILVSHFMDLASRACSKSIVTYTDFLGLHERDLFLKQSRSFGTSFKIFGGYEDSERAIAAFLPSFSYTEECDFPIDCIEVTYSRQDKDKLSHRDFLGALLGLGIKRGLIGDIKVDKDSLKAYVFVLNNISAYICDNLYTVGRAAVDTCIKPLSELDIQPEFTEKRVTVPSMRLDCILGSAFNLSRSSSADMIKAGLTFVNGMEILNVSHTVKDGDIISLRKHGKFKVTDGNYTTKKNKLVLTISIYK